MNAVHKNKVLKQLYYIIFHSRLEILASRVEVWRSLIYGNQGFKRRN